METEQTELRAGTEHPEQREAGGEEDRTRLDARSGSADVAAVLQMLMDGGKKRSPRSAYDARGRWINVSVR